MPRILLVEPHDATRAAIGEHLAALGLDVVLGGAPQELADQHAATRPDAVVLAADLPDAEGVTRRLRQVDPLALLVVADRQHLGQARGIQALLPLRANAYVADPTSGELGEKLTLLLSQQAAARARLRGVPLLLSRTAVAQGEVKAGVVARLVHQVWRSLSDGALVLAGDGPERRLYFQRGLPVAAESDDPDEALAGWLGPGLALEEGAHHRARAALAAGLSPGAALISAGALAPGESLRAGLAAHLRGRLLASMGASRGSWRFHAGDDFAAQLQLVEVAPLPALLEGARAHLPVKHFADALKAVLAAYPVRTAEYDRLVPEVELAGGDAAVAASLDGRASTRAVLEAHKADLKEALSLLWFLSMTGAVAFHGTPGNGAARPAGAAGPTLPPLPADRAEAIRQAALRILPGTYFHALGVDIAADSTEVEQAWREVMARFDPASFAEYEVGDLADLLRSVQDKVTAAHRVLVNDEKRRHYLSFLLLKSELSGARSPGIVLEAEVAMKRGERALRARRNAEAVSALGEAVERNPREPEYLALLAFAELHDPVLPPRVRALEAKRHAEAALQLDQGHLRARVVLALAEALAGDHPAARAAIDQALRLHPHSELARRVHLRLLRPARA